MKLKKLSMNFFRQKSLQLLSSTPLETPLNCLLQWKVDNKVRAIVTCVLHRSIYLRCWWRRLVTKFAEPIEHNLTQPKSMYRIVIYSDNAPTTYFDLSTFDSCFLFQNAKKREYHFIYQSIGIKLELSILYDFDPTNQHKF